MAKKNLSPDSSNFRVIPVRDSALIHENILAVFRDFKGYFDQTTILSYNEERDKRAPNYLQRDKHIDNPPFHASSKDGQVYLEDNLRIPIVLVYRSSRPLPPPAPVSLPLKHFMTKYRTLLEAEVIDSVTFHDPEILYLCYTKEHLIGFVSCKQLIHRGTGHRRDDPVDTIESVIYIQTSNYKQREYFTIDRVRNKERWKLPPLKEVTFSPEPRTLTVMNPADHHVFNPFKPHKIEWTYNYSEDLVIKMISLRKVKKRLISEVVLIDTVSSSRKGYWWVPKLKKNLIEEYEGEPATFIIQSVKDTNVKITRTCFISAPFQIKNAGYVSRTGGSLNIIKLSWGRVKWTQGQESPVEISDQDEVEIDLLDARYRFIQTLSDTALFKDKKYRWESEEVMRFYLDHKVKDSMKVIFRVRFKKDPDKLVVHSEPVTLKPTGIAIKIVAEAMSEDSISTVKGDSMTFSEEESMEQEKKPKTESSNQRKQAEPSPDIKAAEDKPPTPTRDRWKDWGIWSWFRKAKVGDLGTSRPE
ncbi:MAG: hypothetical protein AAFW00_10285 [Bacteroidota bacterium]